MTAIDPIKDGIQRIMLGMREGRFTKDQLEFIRKWFKAAEEMTAKKLAEINKEPNP